MRRIPELAVLLSASGTKHRRQSQNAGGAVRGAVLPLVLVTTLGNNYFSTINVLLYISMQTPPSSLTSFSPYEPLIS